MSIFLQKVKNVGFNVRKREIILYVATFNGITYNVPVNYQFIRSRRLYDKVNCNISFK